VPSWNKPRGAAAGGAWGVDQLKKLIRSLHSVCGVDWLHGAQKVVRKRKERR
jgi:hypothetical protein